ncbi:MAG: hypothetical protein DRN95_06910 [Candidatus Hydrothermarchaeota archaeon]|nr:MAG: hypothetical protein DRN95_06910 [Candidatus Hydrothermarchaeota archaeon]
MRGYQDDIFHKDSLHLECFEDFLEIGKKWRKNWMFRVTCILENSAFELAEFEINEAGVMGTLPSSMSEEIPSPSC